MEQQPKKPRLSDEEVTARLKEGARKRRPWTVGSVLVALVVFGLPLGGLVWWLWPRPRPPHALVVVCDELTKVGQPATMTAYLVRHESEDPGAHLADWSMHIAEAPEILLGRDTRNPGSIKQTDPGGMVRWTVPAQDAPFLRSFTVNYASHKYYRGEDWGRLFCWLPDARLLIVDLPQDIGQTDWEKWRSSNIHEVPLADDVAAALLRVEKTGRRIVYLAGAEPLLHRKLRGWLQLQAATGKLPDGPVLGCVTGTAQPEELFGIVRQLQQQFPTQCCVLSTRAERSGRYRELGVTVLEMPGPMEPPAGVIAVSKWSELAAKLP